MATQPAPAHRHRAGRGHVPALTGRGHSHRAKRRRPWLIPTSALVVAVIIGVLALVFVPQALGGDAYQPYQGHAWHATSQGVTTTFDDNVATLHWRKMPGRYACNPTAVTVRFTVPNAHHVMRGVVRKINPCAALLKAFHIGQPVVVTGNPATGHLLITPAGLQPLWSCGSKYDRWCFDRG
jgi:hypothetical protein